jgi:M6 family metalloprotease-like protein
MARVEMTMPERPMYVGSFEEVEVRTDLRFEDLLFELPAGRAAGVISLSRPSQAEDRPHITICAGYEPGRHILQVFERSSDQLLLQEPFEITAEWRDDELGPGLWFDGVIDGVHGGAAWGGGPAGVQGAGIVKAPPKRQLALLFVDTSSQRYPSGAAMQTLMDQWLDEAVRGVQIGGKPRSAAHYYREVSRSRHELTAQAFGPFSLSGSWDGYFNPSGTPKNGFWQTCATAADPTVDFKDFGGLVCITPNQPAGKASAWPYGAWGTPMIVSTADGATVIGAISMPAEWKKVDGRQIHATLVHELGHTLFLGDHYGPDVPDRNIRNWDPMDKEGKLPHFTLWHKLALGWVDPEEIEVFDFAASGGAVNKTVALHPVEAGPPPAGRKSGIQVRVQTAGTTASSTARLSRIRSETRRSTRTAACSARTSSPTPCRFRATAPGFCCSAATPMATPRCSRPARTTSRPTSPRRCSRPTSV